MVQFTEQEKQIISLHYDQHKTYPEICSILHVSPKKIHAALEKYEESRQALDTEHYAKVNELFSEGKTPLEVASILRRSLKEINELYLEYLKGTRLVRFVKLYREIGEEGIDTILSTTDIMREIGFNTSIKQFIEYVMKVRDKELDLDVLSNKYESLRIFYHNLQTKVQSQEKDRRELQADNLKTKNEVETARKEARKYNDFVARVKQEYPQTEIMDIARKEAEKYITSKPFIKMASEVIIDRIRNDPEKIFLVNPLPRDLYNTIILMPNGLERLQAKLQQQLDDISYQLYLNALDQIVDNIKNKRSDTLA